MKYKDFSSDKNLVSSEDTIFIRHMWRYHGCHGYLSLSQQEKSITASRYLARSLCSLVVRYRVEHSKIKFVSTRFHVISSI